jgi:hypothetical protein
MGVGAAVVRADWIAFDSMWVAPIENFVEKISYKKRPHITLESEMGGLI